MIRQALVWAVFLALVVSCQPSKPQILQLFYQVNENWNPLNRTWSESLSVHVQAQNEDSVEDLDRLNLINDGERLWWQIKKESWVRQDRNGEVWVGSNAVDPLGGRQLPRGGYRVQLVARSGETAETRFSLAADREGPGGPRPQVDLKKDGDTLVLEGFPPSYLIWVYADRGEFLASKKQLGPRFKLSDLIPDPGARNRARLVYFYSYLPRDGTGLRAGPYDLHLLR